MKKLGLLLFTICFVLSSCSNDSESSRQEEAEKLSKMFDELITLSEQKTRPCNNPEEWTYTKLNIPCHHQFIVYSKKINTEVFLKKVERYKTAAKAHSKKWKLECFDDVIPGTLKGIECIDGKPILVYE
ncbi:hypothetical protein ACFSJW_05165 [Flavobacterium artemisiae]|uniref:Lipoprotein n=1 Tax=Flavobacterium artemisiae TaxID=2126556 RepID=A0ABW4HMM6_9FLAO